MSAVERFGPLVGWCQNGLGNSPWRFRKSVYISHYNEREHHLQEDGSVSRLHVMGVAKGIKDQAYRTCYNQSPVETLQDKGQ